MISLCCTFPCSLSWKQIWIYSISPSDLLYSSDARALSFYFTCSMRSIIYSIYIIIVALYFVYFSSLFSCFAIIDYRIRSARTSTNRAAPRAFVNHKQNTSAQQLKHEANGEKTTTRSNEKKTRNERTCVLFESTQLDFTPIDTMIKTLLLSTCNLLFL